MISGASEIKVQLHSGKQVKAKLIGKDTVSDIGVLKIDNTKGIKSIKFANSSKVQTGDSVFAMGNPLGLEFANSVTSGIISRMSVQLSQILLLVVLKLTSCKLMLNKPW